MLTNALAALGIAAAVLIGLFLIGWRMAGVAVRDPCRLCKRVAERDRRDCPAANCPDRGAAL